jgi:rhodanese-related sulfurtransferase
MKSLFTDKGFISCGILNVSPHEAFDLCSVGAIIVDVREENLIGFKNFDVPVVLFLPKSRLMDDYSELPLKKYLIFADTVGLRSKESVVFLKDKGYERIANMAGGIVDWERDGLPLKTNIEERLSGSCMCQLKPRESKKKNPQVPPGAEK